MDVGINYCLKIGWYELDGILAFNKIGDGNVTIVEEGTLTLRNVLLLLPVAMGQRCQNYLEVQCRLARMILAFHMGMILLQDGKTNLFK